MAKEKIFAHGMKFERPKDGTPEFVKGKISVKVDDFTAFLDKYKNENGWVTIDLKNSKEGKLYLELNQWKKTDAKPSTEKKAVDDIPF